MLPRITLVTPSFQQGPFLAAALDSVVAQHYPNLEWLVLDGGSTDESVAILRRYESHFTYWTSERDAGQTAALARGFARATGEILGWLNSDDLLEPGALERVGMYFAAHPDCDFLCGDGVFVDADASRREYVVHGGAYSLAQLLHYCDNIYLPQPAVFFSRRAYSSAGGLDATWQYAMDLDLWLRLRQQYPLHYLPHLLARLRVHANAKMEQGQLAGLEEVEKVTRRYWDHVGAGERARLALGLRSMHARAHCKYGLARVLQGDPRAARSSLQRALAANPLVLVSPDGRRLAARLFLPLALRRRVLRVP